LKDYQDDPLDPNKPRSLFLVIRNGLKKEKPRNPYKRGRLSTVDLLAPPGLDQLLLNYKHFFYLFTKQVTLVRRSTVLNLSLQ